MASLVRRFHAISAGAREYADCRVVEVYNVGGLGGKENFISGEDGGFGAGAGERVLISEQGPEFLVCWVEGGPFGDYDNVSAVHGCW